MHAFRWLHVLCSSGANTLFCFMCQGLILAWDLLSWQGWLAPELESPVSDSASIPSIHHHTQQLDMAPRGGEGQIHSKHAIKEATSSAHQFLTRFSLNLHFYLHITHLFHVLIVQCFWWLQVGPGSFDLFPFRPQDAQVILEIKERRHDNWMHPVWVSHSVSQCSWWNGSGLLVTWHSLFSPCCFPPVSCPATTATVHSKAELE